jgi:imidazolonepropionase-like amidohydrolase
MRKFFKYLLIAAGSVTALLIVGAATLYALYRKDLYVPDDASRTSIVIRGGTLFDATRETPIANQLIVIRNGTIACIGEFCTPDADAVEIDATGLAITPGLIDLHVHFLAITADNAELGTLEMVWDTIRLRPRVRRTLLEQGITSIRDVGDPEDVMLDFKTLVETGELAGPRLFITGPLFTAPGGHPAIGGRDPNTSGFGGNMAFQSDDPEAIARKVESLAARGVDGIKAVFHGATSETGETLLPTLSAETLTALIEVARANDLWVAVHVGPQDEAGIAAELGATTVEHGVRSGNLIDDTTLDRLRRNNVVYVPTLGREPQGHLNIPAIYAAGITIGVGTDTNNPEMAYGTSYHEELARLVAAGMPPAAVLIAATRNSARGIGAAESLGTIETGKLADILLVRGAPWRDIGDLGKVEIVIQDGRMVVDRRKAAD